MTDELNTQAVASTETPAAPVVEGNGAQAPTDYDSVMAEFDQINRKSDTPSPAPAAQQPAAAVPPDALKRIEQLERSLAEQKTAQDIKPVISNIRGDIPENVLSNEEVLDLIDGRARRDPRLQKAWLEREANPGTWKKIEKALGQELSKKFSKLPDPNATEDREAVTAAVRGASSRAPEGKVPEYGSMNNNEFRSELQKLGINSPV